MTKTFTPSQPVVQPTEQSVDEAEQQHQLFYESIKPQLDGLIKDPSQQTIDAILAFSKKG